MKTTEYNFNSKYLTKDNKPWFPIMGEMHYSRYPKQYWKESLYKMKAGGVDIVSAYVIWIHHEEIEKQYDFTEQRDLREFVRNVKECGLKMFLRIGPWSHGEVRNGGFPDWLLRKDYELRTNNQEYFDEIKRLYGKIFEQVEGFLFKEGGPIVGVQIENEYGHCGGLNGEEGEKHMRTLTEIAKEVGFDVPYYTATGWGGAVTGGLLPVMGGYCEAPWDQRLTEIEPSGNYIFTHERNDHNIGSDYGFGTGITYDIDKFPFLTAELGGGLQVTHHRRPVAHSKDIGAMSMVKLGCGVNLLGYYMYHGGTNPKGKLTTLQETRATGYPNDLPELSYDFRAPIREYGQISNTFREIKMLSMFIKDFGSELCKMEAFIPKENPLYQTDLESLRVSVRRNQNTGYVFVNNYQRRRNMAEHKDVSLKVALEDGDITFPAMNIADQDFFFLPFHMPVGDAILRTALATPLCILAKDVKDTYVFYADREPNYDIVGNLADINLVTISREDAKNAWKLRLDRDYLVITEAACIENGTGYDVISRNEVTLKVYPEFSTTPKGYEVIGKEVNYTIYKSLVKVNPCKENFVLVSETEHSKTYEIEIAYADNIEDCFLNIDFGGDTAKFYINGELAGDWFYTGQPWEIGLKRFGFPKKLMVEIEALKEEDKRFLETWPEMKDGKACELNQVKVYTEIHQVLCI